MARVVAVVVALMLVAACGSSGHEAPDAPGPDAAADAVPPDITFADGGTDPGHDPGPGDLPDVRPPEPDAAESAEALPEPAPEPDSSDVRDVPDASDVPDAPDPGDVDETHPADLEAEAFDLPDLPPDLAPPDALDAPPEADAPDPADVPSEAIDTTADEVSPPTCPPACPPLVTELVADNPGSVQDDDGDASDWIELYNPTPLPLALEGWHLTDDPGRPARWTFPAVTLAPGAYLLVFASGKDRADPTRPLHTDFKLARDGEYLALTAPDGHVVQAFAPFPPQAPGVSYGPQVAVARTPFVGPGSPVRWTAPSTGLADGWAAPGFDDSSPDWADGVLGLGFDRVPGGEPPADPDSLGPPIADSLADWSVDGVQGANGWTYGYFDRTHAPDGAYAVDAFVPFPRDGAGYGPGDFWTGSAFDWFQGDPPWTALGAEYEHPAGENNGVEHWVVRRYRAEVDGPLYVRWHVAKIDANGGGVTARVFANGVEVDAAALAAWDTAGFTRAVIVPSVAAGDPIDLALAPTGPEGQPEDWSDGSLLSASLWRLPVVGDLVTTDVGDALAGQGTMLLARAPFDVPAGAAFDRLHLRVRFDDGFAAWLNGQPVASANVPDPLEAGAPAPADRPAADAVRPLELDVREHLGALVEGPNVLAVAAVNAAVDDPTLLAVPELEGRTVAYDPASGRYYGTPTPGADNDDAPVTVGPLLDLPRPQGSPGVDDDLVVAVRVTPLGNGVAGVTLVVRVMFGPETPVPMVDVGQGVYAATLPAGTAAPGEMIRWYVVATDLAGNASRAPAFDDPVDSEQYVGTVVADPSVVSNLPVHQWFVENPDAAGTWTGARGDVFFGGELYDNVRFDLHGQSTSGFPKKSYDLDFTADHRFLAGPGLARMKDINVLTNWADKTKVRNTMAYEIHRDAGAGYHLAWPLRVQQNGAFFEVGDFVEDGDDRWLERLGLDPEGALYKMYDGLWDANYGEKKTRKHEDNSDLAAFIADLDRTGDDLRLYLYDHVNLAAMANFYASLTITATTDCCHKNFYAYRDTNGTGEWRYLPWDVDLTFGHNWTPEKYYFEDALHPDNPLFVGWSKLTVALFALPEFQAMYLRRLRTLMDLLVQPPDTPPEQLRFEARMDQLATLIGADAALDHDAWPTWGVDEPMNVAIARVKADFLAPRRVYLYETMTGDAGPPIPPAQDHPAVLVADADPSPQAPAEAYVVLVNPNPFAVDLTGWRLAGQVAFTFPPGTVLTALGQVFVAADVNAFRARAVPPSGGLGLLVQGPFAGTLSDVSGVLLLDDTGAGVPDQP